MLVYTSVTKSYIPKARVLARSVKRFHPDWEFVVVLSDTFPEDFDPEQEPFDRILTIDNLDLPDWKSWAFGHTIVELCTAVKGPAAQIFADDPAVKKIMYLDPDIKVFSTLSPLETLLDNHDILLTPHLLDTEEAIAAIQDNEISALKHGTYNLGFFCARTSGQGLDFIRWWAHRLTHFCIDDIPNGLFTDQKWCDLAPCFFDRLHIIRDRGYNVATWNISHRPLSRDTDGTLLAGSTPLRFYHFTGYDSGAGLGMLKKYATDQTLAHEIWNGYLEDLNREGHGHGVFRGWDYERYNDGSSISEEARLIYRSREDLKKAFPDPYSLQEPCYKSWYAANNNSVHHPVPAAQDAPFFYRIKPLRKLSKSIKKRLGKR